MKVVKRKDFPVTESLSRFWLFPDSFLLSLAGTMKTLHENDTPIARCNLIFVILLRDIPEKEIIQIP